jgi:hypothetical protein
MNPAQVASMDRPQTGTPNHVRSRSRAGSNTLLLPKAVCFFV